MRFTFFVLLFATVLSFPATADAGPMAGERPVWFGLGVGASGTGPQPDVGGGTSANLTVGIRLLPVSFELILREGVAGLGSDDVRHIAGVGGGVKFLPPRLGPLRATVRVAFAHQHELAWDLYTESLGSALRSTVGIHDAIVHRSGIEVGGGLEVLPDPNVPFGLYAQTSAIILPGTAGPPVTIQTEIGLAIAVGKPLR